MSFILRRYYGLNTNNRISTFFPSNCKSDFLCMSHEILQSNQIFCTCSHPISCNLSFARPRPMKYRCTPANCFLARFGHIYFNLCFTRLKFYFVLSVRYSCVHIYCCTYHLLYFLISAVKIKN
jgi:hypothetical protein